MAAKTRADLIAEVARRFSFYMTGTASGGSTTTIVDSDGLYAPDDYYNGHYAYILTDAGGAGAAPQGEQRPVTDYVQSTKTLTVAPAFSAAVAAADVYELLPVGRMEIIAAINAGVRAAGETWLIPKTDDSTIDLAAGDYDYSLPAALARMLNVWTRSATDEAWQPLDGRLWWVQGTPGAQVLEFKNIDALDADDTIRIEYLARPSELSTDAGTLGIGEPAETELVQFVVAEALFWLHDQAASRAPEAATFRPHLTQAQYYAEQAQAIKQAARGFRGRGTLHGPRWPRSRG
jgi:hypothetical protein